MTMLPEGKLFWKHWAGFVTRGKTVFIIPALAYACMIPFVVCAFKYEPCFNIVGMMEYPGLPSTSAMHHLGDHFGGIGIVKWMYCLKATEIGPVDKVATLQ